MFFLHKHIAPIPARMMTWEVTTAFDGTLTETELQNRFDEEFHDAMQTLGTRPDSHDRH